MFLKFEIFSEEKIQILKVNGRQTPSKGKSSHCLWQGQLKNLLHNIYKWIDGDIHNNNFMMYIDVRQKYQQHKGDLDQFSYTYKLDIFIKNIKRNVKL